MPHSKVKAKYYYGGLSHDRLGIGCEPTWASECGIIIYVTVIRKQTNSTIMFT